MYVVFQVFRKILVNIMEEMCTLCLKWNGIYRVENYSGIIMINIWDLKVYRRAFIIVCTFLESLNNKNKFL